MFFRSLLIIDVLFIFAHSVVVMCFDSGYNALRLDALTLSSPEFFQYLKYLMIIFSIIYFILRKKKYQYITVLLLFLFLMFDDIVQFHQKASAYFINTFDLRANMERNISLATGQIIYLVTVLAIFLMVFLVHFKTASKDDRMLLISILKLLGIFLFFGVIVDLLHTILSYNEQITSMLTIIEEGGEMLSLSLIVGYFYLLVFMPERLYSIMLPYGIYIPKKEATKVNLR